MRIVVASPPKTGNVWLKYLLSSVYDLAVLTHEPADVADFKRSVEKGWFRDNSIFHQHLNPEEEFFQIMGQIGGTVLTTIRNPYDVFVSLYYFVQNFPENFSNPANSLHILSGKPLHHPDVIDYIKRVPRGFRVHILIAKRWLDGGRTLVVRYEDLHRDTVNELHRVTDNILPVSRKRLEKAVAECSAGMLSRQNDAMNKHIRKAMVGDWKNHLNEDHLEAFRVHAKLIESIGYSVI